jgi:hypothetical protein
VTIPIRLVRYIIYVAPITSPHQPPSPPHLRAIARGFFVLFYMGMWSPSTIYATVISFIHLLPSLVPPHTHCNYFIVLWFLIFKLMFKGVSQCILNVGIFFFGSFNAIHCSLTPLPSPIIQQHSIHILILSQM